MYFWIELNTNFSNIFENLPKNYYLCKSALNYDASASHIMPTKISIFFKYIFLFNILKKNSSFNWKYFLNYYYYVSNTYYVFSNDVFGYALWVQHNKHNTYVSNLVTLCCTYVRSRYVTVCYVRSYHKSDKSNFFL